MRHGKFTEAEHTGKLYSARRKHLIAKKQERYCRRKSKSQKRSSLFVLISCTYLELLILKNILSTVVVVRDVTCVILIERGFDLGLLVLICRRADSESVQKGHIGRINRRCFFLLGLALRRFGLLIDLVYLREKIGLALLVGIVNINVLFRIIVLGSIFYYNVLLGLVIGLKVIIVIVVLKLLVLIDLIIKQVILDVIIIPERFVIKRYLLRLFFLADVGRFILDLLILRLD